MTRHFVLGNGHISVGLDRFGRVRDFYFPFVGQENHVHGKIHRIGVWIDGMFSWLSSDVWKREISYRKDSLVTQVVARRDDLGIELVFNDTVLHNKNVLLRRMTIKSAEEREVRLFFHAQYHISEGNVGDTVYFNPFLQSLIHYKGKRYFLMNGMVDGKGIDDYATGLSGELGHEGTWRDAEDGVLSKNPIEHGSVDGTVGFRFSVRGEKEVFFWTAVGDCFDSVAQLNNEVLADPKGCFERSEAFFVEWANRTNFKFQGLSQEVVDLFKRSLLVISTQVDQHGSIIASSDSQMLFERKDTYAYMWPRDGALVARSLDRAGYAEITENFFAFCGRVLTVDGYLFHKYRPDGSLGSSWHPWLNHGHVQLPIQEDQIALVLDALWKHYLQHGNKEYLEKIFDSYIRRAADFMAEFMDEKTGLPKESYDLWEEKLGVHTFTCATVYAGFLAAAHFEDLLGDSDRAQHFRNLAAGLQEKIVEHLWDEERGFFIKMVALRDGELVKDYTLDLSSVYGIFEYEVLPVDDDRVRRSVEAVEKKLKCTGASGGYARYEDDYYHRVDKEGTPGNPWFITTLWLAEYYIKLAQSKEGLQGAVDIFEWVSAHALETGILSEQLHPHTGEAVSVAPLTWSHAGFVIAINKYLEKLDLLGVCDMCNPPKIKRGKFS